VPLILRKEDRPLFTYVIDEGAAVEPGTYYPIIPMVLINGAYGIGTGYSTFIPNHNPLDVIRWLRMKLQGIPDKDLPFILPWYRGFEGIIKVIDRRRRKKRAKVTVINTENNEVATMKENDDDDATPVNEGLTEEEDEEYDALNNVDGTRPLLSVITMGKFHIDMNGTIVITELPVGRWPVKYHKWLEDLVEEKKITGFRDCSVNEKVYFEIYGFTEPVNYRTLKLQKTMGMSNMVVLDENSRPIRYDTAFDILEAFHSRRLPIYQRRKDYVLQHLAEEIVISGHKIRFIRGVIAKQIHIINRKIADIHVEMDILNIPHEIYEASKTRNLSVDDIEKLTDDIATKEAEIENIRRTTPEQLWLMELDELETVYRRIHHIKPITLNINNQVTLNVEPSPQRQPAQGIRLNLSPITPNTKLNLTPINPSTPKTELNLTPHTKLNLTPHTKLNLTSVIPNPMLNITTLQIAAN